MTKDKDVPSGEIFERVYGLRGDPITDSPKLRARLNAFLDDSFSKYRDDIGNELRLELGVDIRRAGVAAWYYDFAGFFKDASTSDLWGFITLAWRVPMRRGNQLLAKNWLAFVNRSMREENVSCYVDVPVTSTSVVAFIRQLTRLSRRPVSLPSRPSTAPATGPRSSFLRTLTVRSRRIPRMEGERSGKRSSRSRTFSN
jgi:hypothetical protein